MQLASVVSERFGFKVPGVYVRMSEAGLLAVARSAPAKAAKSTRRSDAEPPAPKGKKLYSRARALAACDLAWLSAEEIVARVERSMPTPGQRASSRASRWGSAFVFVPFAESRAGDEWGWAPSLGEPGAVEPPVMFRPLGVREPARSGVRPLRFGALETEDARIVAPTFATFLFRLTLESLAECPHDPSEMDLAERVAMLRGSARAVLDFLPAELSARLDRVLDLPVRKVMVRTLRERGGKFFRASETTHLSLVGTEWAARIVREELEDPRIDQPLRVDG
ncbi:MAG: hypothetical protein KIS78_15765 [Labilithrix sp.]|nr:hypothetical protein [Labilithrix sp.]MCW5833858.1 hypothetical protein [Labilithrix sp.]